MSRKQVAAQLTAAVPAGPPPGMDYQAQLQAIARQRAIAQQLGQPPERTSMAGGLVVPYSAGEGLTRLGQAFLSTKMNDQLDTKESAARGQYQQGRTQAMTDLSNAPAVTPELADRLTQYGIDPKAMQAIMHPAPIIAKPGESGIDPNTYKPLFSVPEKPESDSVDYVGLGDKRQPVSHRTGKPVPGLDPLAMGQTPNQARESFTDQHAALLAAMAARGVTLPSGLRSKEQMRSTLDGLIQKYPNLGPDDIADNIATGKINFGAENKAAQIGGAQAGRVALGLNEINEFAPLVKDASAKVPRGSFVPLNKLLQYSDAQLSDPNLRQLKIAVTSMLNAYDQVAARGGTDVGKREAAHQLLTSADSPEALNAAVAMFQREAQAAERAAQTTMHTTPKNQQLPAGVTEDDINETMRANGMTRDQVLQKLNAR